MPKRKKIFSHQDSPYQYRLYDAQGDLSKEWFIEYYDERKKRKRIYGKINQIHDLKERRKGLKQLLKLTINKHIAKSQSELTGIKKEMQIALEEKLEGMRLRTQNTYRSKMRMFIEFMQGRKVNPDTVKAFFEHRKKKNHKVTFNDDVIFFNQIFKRIGKLYLMNGIEKQKKAFSEPYRLYQGHQIKKLKEHMIAHDPQLWLFVCFVYYCALRPDAELMNLRVEAINFEDWFIVVKGKEAKNGRQRLASIPVAFRKDIEAAYKHKPMNEYLFPSRNCTIIKGSYKRMYDRHHAVLKKLGFGKGYTVYSWRYTGAVAAVKAGVPINKVKEQFDHHSLDQLYGYLRRAGVVIDMEELNIKFPGI